MTHLPVEQGIVDKILDAIQVLLTTKLHDEVDPGDASRLATIKVGPRQDDPSSVVILIHENDPDNAKEWPHYPVRYERLADTGLTTGRRTIFGGEGEAAQLRHSYGYELVGGGSRMARAFTIQIEVWGDEVPNLTLERRDVGQLASVLENRSIKALREAGPKINTGDLLTDSFGESVMAGPFWGDAWTDQEEGESLIVRKMIRFYYHTSQSWDTNAW